MRRCKKSWKWCGEKVQTRGSRHDSVAYFFIFVVVAFLVGAAALRLGRVGGSGSSSDWISTAFDLPTHLAGALRFGFNWGSSSSLDDVSSLLLAWPSAFDVVACAGGDAGCGGWALRVSEDVGGVLGGQCEFSWAGHIYLTGMLQTIWYLHNSLSDGLVLCRHPNVSGV